MDRLSIAADAAYYFSLASAGEMLSMGLSNHLRLSRWAHSSAANATALTERLCLQLWINLAKSKSAKTGKIGKAVIIQSPARPTHPTPNMVRQKPFTTKRLLV
jgi:hypothetical protein